MARQARSLRFPRESGRVFGVRCSAGVTRPTAIFIASAPQPRLAITIAGESQVQVLVYRFAGQQQVIQGSSNLVNWTSLATNLFQLFDSLQAAARFYRALAVP
jgi:hypothetical protein